jgi:aspartate carbamoyltransferase catalytic subunit
VQAERGSGEFVPTLREYTAGYGLTSRRAAMLPTGSLILHPGPIVRGVEIASDVAELPAALITEQVSNGVAVRMAVLFLLLGQMPTEGSHHV